MYFHINILLYLKFKAGRDQDIKQFYYILLDGRETNAKSHPIILKFQFHLFTVSKFKMTPKQSQFHLFWSINLNY